MALPIASGRQRSAGFAAQSSPDSPNKPDSMAYSKVHAKNGPGFPFTKR
jgi:hypothetical protein